MVKEFAERNLAECWQKKGSPRFLDVGGCCRVTTSSSAT